MIIGAHAIVYSKDAEADRAFLRDVLGFPSVDAGGGWLIFALPPSEMAVHPSDENGVHELYLLCDDVRELARSLEEKGVVCSPIREERWGSVVQVTLPGGGQLGIYWPKHPRPKPRKERGAPARPKARAKAKAKRGRR
jgi:catechol 2,3-dioxygenase-like lactoylglutathione lyase family enzyme